MPEKGLKLASQYDADLDVDADADAGIEMDSIPASALAPTSNDAACDHLSLNFPAQMQGSCMSLSFYAPRKVTEVHRFMDSGLAVCFLPWEQHDCFAAAITQDKIGQVCVCTSILTDNSCTSCLS